MSVTPHVPHPLLQEASDAISKVYFWDRHQSLACAIDERLAMTVGLAEHLAESFDNAAHFRANLDFNSLFRVMTLLHRELQGIEALFSVLCNDKPQQVANMEVGP